MGAYKELDGDAPTWAQQIYFELCELRAKQEAIENTKSLTVGSAEASKLLDICTNTLRAWHEEGKLPKNVGKGRHLKFERAAIERLAKAIKTGRSRKAV